MSKCRKLRVSITYLPRSDIMVLTKITSKEISTKIRMYVATCSPSAEWEAPKVSITYLHLV